MVISKYSNLVCRKRLVQTRFNVFLSPFVAYKAVQFLWRYIYDKIQFTEMAIQLVESDIQQVKFDKKKATKGEKH